MKVLAIDQGTTATKGFVYADDGSFAPVAAIEHRQIYPRAGWVEHDAAELLDNVMECVRKAGPVDAIGLDNQGETVIAWDAHTGQPICNAIVWQDDRTADVTGRMKAEGLEARTMAIAGLPLDPYFSASKLGWIMRNVELAEPLRRQGRLRLGTSDSYFLARLTRNFATDITTASRTSLMDLDTGRWSAELCEMFGVPVDCLPEIRPSAGSFGEHIGMKVTAGIVDQQAALFGHGCMRPGMAKLTFGTGAFALANTGEQRVDGSRFGINSTIAWQLGDAPPQRALEGGLYNAASAVNWARSLKLFDEFSEIAMFDGPSALSRKLVFVPALSGLGCPYWDRSAAGLWLGLGLETTARDMMQALLEGVALRAGEVMQAMGELAPLGDSVSVDGGLTRNAYFNKFLARALNKTIVVQGSPDLTALGTARLAMLGAGLSADSLPPLPEPRAVIEPASPLGPQDKTLFAEAVKRAREWK
jgi:glycerol kinase